MTVDRLGNNRVLLSGMGSFRLALALSTIAAGCALMDSSSDPNCPPTLEVPVRTFFEPAWHPSGEFITFNHIPLDSLTFPFGPDCPGRQHFDMTADGYWAIDVDGTNLRLLWPRLLVDVEWSPDGEWIAFSHRGELKKMRFVDGSFDSLSTVTICDAGWCRSPTWSPDMEWIAYDSDDESPGGASYIWRIRADGTESSRIGYSPVGATAQPNWSRITDRIAFRHYPGNTESTPELYKMSAGGGGWLRLTNNKVIDTAPKYAPDESLIAFGRQQSGGQTELWVMMPDGGNKRRLPTQRVDLGTTSFSWSPDSRWIAYTRYDFREWSLDNSTIWVVNIQTGELRQLTTNSEHN